MRTRPPTQQQLFQLWAEVARRQRRLCTRCKARLWRQQVSGQGSRAARQQCQRCVAKMLMRCMPADVRQPACVCVCVDVCVCVCVCGYVCSSSSSSTKAARLQGGAAFLSSDSRGSVTN
jgi:hypothetical protein